jgi:hypothetical protein
MSCMPGLMLRSARPDKCRRSELDLVDDGNKLEKFFTNRIVHVDQSFAEFDPIVRTVDANVDHLRFGTDYLPPGLLVL